MFIPNRHVEDVLMKRKNSELVGGGCSGECRITYGSIRDFGSEVGIRSVRKRQINVRTDEPVAGTEQILPVATLDQTIRDLLRRHLEAGFVYKADSCPRGCFCNPIGISDETSKQLKYTIKLREKTTRAQVYIEKGADTNEKVLDDVRSGARVPKDSKTSQPVPINPDLDELVKTAENCCGTIEIDMDVKNWFEYEFEIEGTLWLVTEIGECDSLDGATT
jgi:hypothetical protein